MNSWNLWRTSSNESGAKTEEKEKEIKGSNLKGEIEEEKNWNPQGYFI